MTRQPESYRFGEWLVEPHLGSVRNGEEVRKLEPKAMDVLVLLLEHSGQVLSSAEILDTVWAGRIVEEGAVSQKISQIRGALGDDRRNPRYIESIPKRGYRTLLPVAARESPQPPPLVGESAQPSAGTSRPGPARAWLVAGLSAAMTVIIAVVVLSWRREDAPGPPRQSVAVLPFANLSGEPGQGHFVDGLTDELLSSLATIDGLRVISRTSSFAVDRSRPLREVATTLGVGHILEGSVRRAGDRIRVAVQLIDARSDSPLWSESYDRELTLKNILQIQQEIARTVVDALHPTLFARARSALSRDGPDNLAALDLYYEGMFHVRGLETGQFEHPTTFQRAIEKLEASIDADPDWAPPHAALGAVFHFWKDFGDAAAKLRMSKGHIMHAIRLDDAYGPAYRSLGYLLTVEGDYDGAMRAYDRSISLGTPSSWGKAMLLSLLARHDAAIDEYREAVAHDPLSVPIRWQLVQASYCAGRYAEVIDGSHSFLSIEPDNAYAAIRLAIAYVRTGGLEEGLHLAEEVAERIGTEAPLAALFALAGQDERARAALDALERNEPDLVPWALVDAAAPAAIALGENDRALDMIEQVIADAASDPDQTFDLVLSLRCTREVRSLAGHPRYDAILDRLGLPS